MLFRSGHSVADTERRPLRPANVSEIKYILMNMLFTQISKKISENKTKDISINLGYLEISQKIS